MTYEEVISAISHLGFSKSSNDRYCHSYVKNTSMGHVVYSIEKGYPKMNLPDGEQIPISEGRSYLTYVVTHVDAKRRTMKTKCFATPERAIKEAQS